LLVAKVPQIAPLKFDFSQEMPFFCYAVEARKDSLNLVMFSPQGFDRLPSIKLY
jgi:hypothetical protein